MGKLNYFFNAPYSNPEFDIEKQTNEFPMEGKAKTTTKKRKPAKTAKATKAKAVKKEAEVSE